MVFEAECYLFPSLCLFLEWKKKKQLGFSILRPAFWQRNQCSTVASTPDIGTKTVAFRQKGGWGEDKGMRWLRQCREKPCGWNWPLARSSAEVWRMSVAFKARNPGSHRTRIYTHRPDQTAFPKALMSCHQILR